MTRLPATAEVVVIGGGIVGAWCADVLAAAGVGVVAVERRSLAGGTTAAGEGNILVSDKLPGPELDLALLATRTWTELAGDLAGAIELDPKGGVIVAATEAGLAGLREVTTAQRTAGVDAIDVEAAGLPDLEPHLTREVIGGAHYPQDQQVQPVLASAHLLHRATSRGATLVTGVEVTGFGRGGDGRITAVHTTAGTIATEVVVNAAGVASAEVARLAGVVLGVEPRRGHILVTEPLPKLIHHKVYDADYVGTLESGDPDLQVSSVVEGTASGTILVGSSRELVGLDRTPNLAAQAAIAARAVGLFPVLARARVIRSYLGFRPWTPDQLPIIGADERVPGLWHATGHEGAGIGLAPATALLIAAGITGSTPPLDPTPFSPHRASLTTPADRGTDATGDTAPTAPTAGGTDAQEAGDAA